MRSQAVWRRTIIALPALVVLLFALFLLLNFRGYRALIVARLLRTNNGTVVVPLPANFQLQVPPGFKVSVLAKGFDQPDGWRSPPTAICLWPIPQPASKEITD
jgi:hypothetical protein